MSLFGLSLAYIRARALNAALNLVLLALGVGMIVLLLLFSAQLEDRLTRDARGIDLVIGSKGSPLQLILSSIYHVDFPTGNIPLADAERWAEHPPRRGSHSAGAGRQSRGLPHHRHRAYIRRALWRRTGRGPVVGGAVRSHARRARRSPDRA